MLAATIIWFASFTVFPAPAAPQRTALFPSTSKTGRSASKADSGPPAMIASSPAMAPGSPPLTGASTKATPRAAAAAAISRENPGLDRGHVGHQGRQFRRRQDPVWTEHHELRIRRVRQHENHRVPTARALGSGCSPPRPGSGQLVHRARRAAMDRKVEPGREQILGHGLSHDPEADESDCVG